MPWNPSHAKLTQVGKNHLLTFGCVLRAHTILRSSLSTCLSMIFQLFIPLFESFDERVAHQ